MVQVNTSHITVRIKFSKLGGLQYISHLDLVRTMHKIIVRAKLPLWYTEGFNPKPKMVFAAPLSIGTESKTEFMDLRLTERVPEREIMERLNENLTDEMRVTEVYYPETKLTELKWFSYTVVINSAKLSSETALECERALNAECVEIEKKTKPGEPKKLVNIAPLIKSAAAVYSNGEIRLSLVLSADQSQFLNPEYAVSALRKYCGILTDENLLSEHYSIMRENAYCADMSEFR
jgi:radical SAM-linked protein